MTEHVHTHTHTHTHTSLCKNLQSGEASPVHGTLPCASWDQPRTDGSSPISILFPILVFWPLNPSYAGRAPTRFAGGFPYYKVHRDDWPWHDPGKMLKTVEKGCPSATFEGKTVGWPGAGAGVTQAFLVLKCCGGATRASWKLRVCTLEVGKAEFKSQL